MKKLLKGINDLLTAYPDLAKEWNYDRNEGKKPSDFLPGSHKTVYWTCKEKHEFEMPIRDRVNGKPCPYCSNYKVLSGFNDLSTVCPDVAKEWNYEKNGELNPSQVKYNANIKAWWKCAQGHDWEAYVFNRSKGHGCPYCTNFSVLTGYNDLPTTKPELVSEWNYEKNGGLSPSSFTAGSHKKVWWKCAQDHEWEASIKSRSSGSKCPYCTNKKILVGFNDLYTICVKNHREDLIAEFDTEKNSFSLKDVISGSDVQIWWKCPNGHSYQATGHRRIRTGSACGICSHNILLSGVNDLSTTHPEIAQEWDWNKNIKKPSEVMAGSNNTKYWFICPKGHSYQSSLLNRIHGTNCPICAMEKHTSFPEKAIFYYINKHFADAEENYRNPMLEAKEIDIYIPKYKVGVEYDGAAWHKDYERDLKKDLICATNGISLIRIREDDCIRYISNSTKKYIPAHNVNELNMAILFIFDYINLYFHLDIHPDVNVDRDRLLILNQITLSEKENSIADYCPIIKSFWDYEKNGKITPEQISHASFKKVFLKCEYGHEWEVNVSNFPSHPWCPYCSGRRVLTGFNDLFTTNPDLVPLWSKNNTLNPLKIKKGSNQIALWTCEKCGGEYDMKISDKTEGRGCPYCSGHRVLIGYNDLQSTFPELLDDWDYEKNAPLKPENVTRGSNKKVWWKCHICNHEWKSTVWERTIKKRKCPECRKKSAIRHNAKQVVQLSVDGTILAEYSSVTEAERQTGIKTIYKACRNPGKTAGGFMWKYKTEL